MVAPSQALEFILSFGIYFHSLPTMFSTELPYNACYNWPLIGNPGLAPFPQ